MDGDSDPGNRGGAVAGRDDWPDQMKFYKAWLRKEHRKLPYAHLAFGCEVCDEPE